MSVTGIYGDDRYVFLYDESGNPHEVKHFEGNATTPTRYFYVTNLQGDVVELRDINNVLVASYSYDAWGNILSVTDANGNEITDSTHIAHANPIRYRGYFYDTETGMYYCNSRYYDPEIGRWISPEPNVDYGEFDEGAGLLGYNVFAYCANNPVSNFDPDGEAVANIVGGVIGGLAGAALGALLAKELGLSGWKKTLFIAGVVAAGAALGAFLGPYMAKLGSKIASMTQNAVSTFKATVRGARTAIKQSKTVTKLIKNASNLKRTRTVTNHLSSRPYINSTTTIKNIMKAGKPVADSSLKNGLKWVVDGTYNGSSGVWELVVDATTNTIVHFLFRSK